MRLSLGIRPHRPRRFCRNLAGMTRLLALPILALVLSSAVLAQSQVSDADAAAIKATALDYIEGYYDGEAPAWSGRCTPTWPSASWW